MYINKIFKKLSFIPSKLIREKTAWTKQEWCILKKTIQKKKRQNTTWTGLENILPEMKGHTARFHLHEVSRTGITMGA